MKISEGKENFLIIHISLKLKMVSQLVHQQFDGF